MTTFKLPPALLSQHIAIIGKTGSGKTYTGKGMVEQLLNDKRRVCILDPTGVWWGLRSSADGKRTGYPVAVFGGEHADVAIAEHSGAALARIIAAKNLPAIIDLSEMLIGQRHRFVTDFAEAIYTDNRMPLHLVIDEADEFCPQNPMPETKRMLHHVDRIVRKGRVRGFRVMLITQRPAVLHKNVLTQANTLIAMRLTAPQDRKAMQAWVEGQADADQAKEVLGSLARLQRGEGWVWAPELGILTRTTFPKITTFDSSRTPEDDEVVVEPSKLATVDLGEIKASFEAVEKEAKTLAELKKQNGQLQRELEAIKARPSAAGVPESEVQRRIREAVAAVPRVQADPSHVRTLRKIAELVAPYHGVSIEGVALGPLQREVNAVLVPRQSAPTLRSVPAANIDGIRAGAVRILQELAARAPAGYSRAQVGALTQFSPKGGTFNTYLGDLRRAGFIEERGGLAFATDAGITALGDQVPKAPTSHEDAMALWRKALRAGAFAMLEAIVAAGRDGITRQEIADQVGMQSSGGTFNTYLGDLRRNGLITEQHKRCTANDILFPKGK
jgi:uncharacterized protein